MIKHNPVKEVDVVYDPISYIKRPYIKVSFESITAAGEFMGKWGFYIDRLGESDIDTHPRVPVTACLDRPLDIIRNWVDDQYLDVPFLTTEVDHGVFEILIAGSPDRFYLSMERLFHAPITKEVSDFSTVCFFWAKSDHYSKELFSTPEMPHTDGVEDVVEMLEHLASTAVLPKPDPIATGKDPRTIVDPQSGEVIGVRGSFTQEEVDFIFNALDERHKRLKQEREADPQYQANANVAAAFGYKKES